MFCPALGAKVLTNCHSDHSPLASASFESARRATRKVLGPWRELKSAALALGLYRCCRFVSKRSRARNACCRAGSPTLGSLRIDGCHFVDEDNRIVLPRGINFSGLSKVPTSPDGATHLGGPQFYEHQDVSFVGRPCSLAELDTHLQRLKDWGFNLLRLVITWEAVEHQGPGMYDEDYLKFLRKVCQRAGDLGFWIIIDPHQDCWSRWTGGDGAPGWTLEAAGFKVAPELHTSGAAFLHQENGDPLPSMSWPSNYDRLGSATMFSLFWAGDQVAPGIKDELQGLSLQECLQGSFLRAMAAVARTLRDVPAVVGFETLNEPHPGWLGTEDLSRPNIGPITTGESPFEQIKRCYGKGPWASECMWAKAGIWFPNENKLQDPGRFHCNWMQQCFAPFVNKFTTAILSEMPHALIGVCPPAFGKESLEAYPETLHPQCFWAPHFYDGIVLLGKVWTPDFGIAETKPGEKLFNLLPAPPVCPVIGLAQRVESYKEQLRQKCDFSSQKVPSILGEIGLPFEIQYVGLPGSQPKDSEETLNEAADAHMQALEQIMLPHCWWNYTPENSAKRGDFWNGENLSIVSNNEGRAPASLIRPYISRCSGMPISQSFSFQEGRFRCEFDVQEQGESVLFVPLIQFPSGPKVSVTPGVEVFADFQSQTLLIRNGQYTGRVVVELRKETGAKKRKNDQK